MIVLRALLALCLIACGSSSQSGAPEAASSHHSPGHGHHGQHAASTPWSFDSLVKGAALLGDVGAHVREVRMASAEAKAYFDQGLALTYGFNHDEAARSFAQAAKLDPSCALCFWGVAYTLGPNYNIPMLPERAQLAWEAITRAQELAPEATPVEQALIRALATRYQGPEYVDPVAMQTFNQRYADAMREVAKNYPDDLDVQVLFAEAAMNLNPWKLWTSDGRPAPGTDEIVTTLETVMAKAPNHPGANHYYIHAVEASPTPSRGVVAAERLGSLIPIAGHIVHMPAHIYQRVGRYADASEANRQAVAADLAYLEKVKPPGYYPFYLGHNYGFLAYSTSMEGRSEESLEASRQSAARIPKDVVCGMPGMDFFLSEPLLVQVRFGRWDDILATKQPDAQYQVLQALWHHAQGMAQASTGNVEGAARHAEAIAIIHSEIPDELLAGLNEGRRVLALAKAVLDARIAEATKAPDAIQKWEAAVALEDSLAYNEPADWFYPVRHYLGAALLDAGRAAEAEAVYRADLERHPKNGWALFGVWKSLQSQKNGKEAQEAEKQFREAWQRADFELTRTAW